MTGQGSSDKVLLGFCLSLVAALVVSVSTAHFQQANQVALDRRREQLQVYADLTGHRATLTQLTVTATETKIFIQFYNRRWQLTGASPASTDLALAREFLSESRGVVLELARQRERTYVTVGKVLATFPRSKKLTELANAILKKHMPKPIGDPETMSLDELEKWKTRVLTDLPTFVEENQGRLIDDLLVHLEPRLPRD
jgi:hypothetical protein